MIAKLVYNSYSSWEDRCGDMGPRLELGAGRAVWECFFSWVIFPMCWLAATLVPFVCILFCFLNFLFSGFTTHSSIVHIIYFHIAGLDSQRRPVLYSRIACEDLRRFPVALPQCPLCQKVNLWRLSRQQRPFKGVSWQQQLPTGVASNRTLILGYYHDNNNGYYHNIMIMV